MRDRTIERRAAKDLEADIQAINEEEMLCLMQGDARTVAQSLSAMGWRKQPAPPAEPANTNEATPNRVASVIPWEKL